MQIPLLVRRRLRPSVLERSPWFQRALLSVVVLGGAGAPDLRAQPAWAPQGVFLQAGGGEQVGAVTVGLTWPWRWEGALGGGQIGGYWEASFSRWQAEAAPTVEQRQLSQWALTPVFRWRASEGASPWFAEAGVGLTHTTSRYQNGGKRFSSRFNFGDHIAIGRSFGLGHRHELLLRVQHFSNASLRRPNPGEDFVQLRYATRFD